MYFLFYSGDLWPWWLNWMPSRIYSTREAIFLLWFHRRWNHFWFTLQRGKDTLLGNWFPSVWIGLWRMYFLFYLACHFSRLLKNWVDDLARSDKNKPLDEQGLPGELKRAVMTCHKKLTPAYEYIPKLREENLQKSLASKKKSENYQEFDKTNSLQQHNVTKVENIKG